jgi:transcription elongation GreA/GreB family factor
LASPHQEESIHFVLNPATDREGNVVVGSTVEVRYRNDETEQVATVVRVQEPKQQAAAIKTSPQR